MTYIHSFMFVNESANITRHEHTLRIEVSVPNAVAGSVSK